MLRSKAVLRALSLSGVIALGLSACAPETSSDSATAGSTAVQTGTSVIGGAGTGARAGSGAGTVSQPLIPVVAGARAAGSGGAGPASTAAGTAAPGTVVGSAGRAAVGGSSGGLSPAAGSGAAGKGAAGMTAAAGAGGGSDAGKGETGRMVGMTAAHNAVRARIMNPKPDPALPPLKWSDDIAKIAQAYADKLASGGNCLALQHSMMQGLGENLAGYGGQMATPEDVTEGWAGEEECYTFGPLMSGDACDMACTTRQNSNGCGHYTQVVWRGTTELGCGMATCGSGRSGGEVWVCNYKAPGNFIGREPY